MKKIIILAIFLSITSTLAAKTNSKTEGPQTYFGIESEVQSSVQIPKDVLELLKKDERALQCLKSLGVNLIPPTWFVASEINLNNDSLMDLIVLAKEPCLYGANVGPFWLFAKTTQGHKLLSNPFAHDLEILKTKTNQYFDIELTSATATQVISKKLKFDGEKYKE